MMLRALMEPGLFVIERDTVTGKDALGKPTTTTADVGTPVDGLLEQLTTVEDGDHVLVVDKYRAFMPYGTDLRAGDRVRARGDRYSVEGRPANARIPGFSAASYLTATLRFVGPVTP